VNYDAFLTKYRGSLEHYAGFCNDVDTHRQYMVQLGDELASIKPFTFSISKCFEVGHLLKCYYGLFSVEAHRRAIAYAIGFDSYMNLMLGLGENMAAGHISRATIVLAPDAKTEFIHQVYPAHIEMEDRVPNTLDLSANIIITGPNASGKTTQLKTTAINIVLTQQFGVGFYEHCSIIPDTSGRDSLFQAEARRCKEILDVVKTTDVDTTRHFCIFDELFSGTNAEEATTASFAFLKYLQGFPNVDFILTTHFVKLCQKVEKAGVLRIANYKMDADVNGNEIVFTYEMVNGISKIKAAKMILIQMGFPDEIIAEMADAK
jgi:DNA mismatch repair ATPase MutS